MSSLIEDGHCVECANLRADYAHAQNRIRELTETLARRTDALHLLEGERNQAKALLLDILQKGGKFLAYYSQQHGDDLAETDEEMALTDACNEFGDALDAARAALAAPDGATGGKSDEAKL